MKYEGHFLLWYLILMPFAKLGFPYITTNIISWIITCISVYLILDKAPFKFYKRVLLILSLPLLYLFPVISRCYCLIPFAIVLLCIFYKDRKEKPFRYLLSIVLLINTHVIMLSMAGLVFLDYLIEFIKDWKNESLTKLNKKRLLALILTIILIFLSGLPLFNCLTTNKTIGDSFDISLYDLIDLLYSPSVFVTFICGFLINNNIFLIFSALLIVVLLTLEIKNYPLDYLKIFVNIIWQTLIHFFIYNTTLPRASSIIFIFLYYKWIRSLEHKKINDIEKKIVNVCFIILVLSNIIQGLAYIFIVDVKNNYSNAYEIGNYINESIDDNSIILNGSNVEYASSIIPYVKKDVKFYHICENKYFTYAIWNDENNTNLKMENIENLPNVFDIDQKLYFVYCTGKTKKDEAEVINECIDKNIFKKVYSTGELSLSLENYILYEVDLSNI